MLRHWMALVLFCPLFQLVATLTPFAYSFDDFGSIKGKVVDENNSNPLSDVKVEIAELSKAALTDSGGMFIFENVSFGSYTIRFSSEGYFHKSAFFKLDSSSSGKELQVKLTPFESVLDTIDVHARYFKKDPQVNTSYNYAVYEELRMSPGAAEDIIKYFQSSPGVTMGNDMENDIICRGGSPIENLTLIDGIEIQNPNHYGPPGSTSGALSFINLKMVQEVDFYSGGFPVKYGDKLSSVMDIKFREGNRNKHYQYLNLSITGFGAFIEGPLNSRSSYMLGVRRSYLELLKDQINTPLIPNYWDVNLKLNYDISNKEKLSLVGLYALDKAKPSDENNYERVDLRIATSGLNFTKTSAKTKFGITLSHSYDYYNVSYDYFNLDIKQHRVDVKADYDNKIADELETNLFYRNKFYFGKYNVYAFQSVSKTGYLLNDIHFNTNLNTFKIWGGANLTTAFLNGKLSCNVGLRFDYLDYMTRGFCFSPRAGLTYKLNEKTFLNLNLGYFSQTPEFLWLFADDDNKNLSYINAKHAVLGAEYFLSEDLRLNLESYVKYYTGYPVSVYDPYFLFLGGGTGLDPIFLSKAVSKGKGYIAGIDFTIQKKNTGAGLYGYLTYSFTKSKFYTMAGGSQPSSFDFGNQLVAIAGWKLKSLWAFSVRAKYSGGMPYTPFDSLNILLSYPVIYEMSKYQKERIPYYLRLDARVEKEFLFGSSNLTVYVEVLNLFDRENIWTYYWDYDVNRTVPFLHFSIIPILGINYRF